MNSLPETVCRITGAKSVQLGEVIQNLWSGYGVIQRAELIGTNESHGSDSLSVVIKHIDISQPRDNRRGWGGDIAHHRKVRSYQIEKRFYESFANQCHDSCQVPHLIGAHEKEDVGGWVMVLEDLNALGFGADKHRFNRQDIEACLNWLASFHATFIGSAADGLWPTGTYWHLETRPNELAAMPDGPLKQSAKQIDRRLNQATHQTLVHGDAKVANFCFSCSIPVRVAAVDFQYVGRGCGMKDVAYLLSSCLDEDEADAQQESLLTYYFQQLRKAISAGDRKVDFVAIEREWRELYPFAWADFCRFLAGWSPDHWKLNQYSKRVTQSVIDQLG